MPHPNPNEHPFRFIYLKCSSRWRENSRVDCGLPRPLFPISTRQGAKNPHSLTIPLRFDCGRETGGECAKGRVRFCIKIWSHWNVDLPIVMLADENFDSFSRSGEAYSKLCILPSLDDPHFRPFFTHSLMTLQKRRRTRRRSSKNSWVFGICWQPQFTQLCKSQDKHNKCDSRRF